MSTTTLQKVFTSSGATDQIRALFEPFDFSAAIVGLLEGQAPGCIFADHPTTPTVAIASTAEGVFLTGRTDIPEVQDAVERFFQQELLTGNLLVKSPSSIYLSVAPSDWRGHLTRFAPGQLVNPTPRYHYVCTAVAYDWRAHVPEEYSIRRIDRALLKRVDIPELLLHQFPVECLWGSIDHVLARAVGFAALRGEEVVAWCTPDCIGGDRIDFACATLSNHRRKGLASATTAASVEAALKMGFHAAGWMCATSNEASWRTAERVGFIRMSSFDEYYFRTSASRCQ